MKRIFTLVILATILLGSPMFVFANTNSVPYNFASPKKSVVKPTYYYKLATCWGNPPVNYQELKRKEREKIQQLQKQYTVIIIPCDRYIP